MKIIAAAFIAGCFSPTMGVNAVPDSQTLWLKDFRYPMMVYAPSENQTGDMIIALSMKKSPQDLIEEWKPTARKGGLHVLAIEIELRDGEQPTFVDNWLLNLKREMALRYRVKNFYLLGYDDRAHYASYFGLRHPQAFTAYAAIGGSWAGPFEKMVKPTPKAKKHAPFFIALFKKDEKLAAAQTYSTDLTGKGYDVRFIVLDRVGEEFSDAFLKDLTSWLKEQNRKKEAGQNKPESFKGKVSTAVDEFLAV